MRHLPARSRRRAHQARRRARFELALLLLAAVAVVEWTLWPWQG